MIPESYESVTVKALANVYFGGQVISHAVVLADGSKKTLGVMLPGSYEFNTGSPERMDIIAGTCRVTLPGDTERIFTAGSGFDVPGSSSFAIAVDEGVAQYVCAYE
ncbi:MAG: pyrimidine/purine nucleoside phosphorylase [Armatimonadetes bacterium]|nr:pyrimidine/purine nucleoside phosphorylase [Armatimonadota bacterium]